MHADLRALGFGGSYDRVAVFAREWRRQQLESSKGASKHTYIPLQFKPGEAFQFDWSEDWAVIAGERVKLQVAHFKLSYSRAFFVRAYLLQTHEMLFDAHHHAFSAWGGIPQCGIVEQPKRVSPTCLITFERTRYSVPSSFANRPVSLHIYHDHLEVIAEGNIIAVHTRVFTAEYQGVINLHLNSIS
jgi:hypothetical protein